jgi:CRISPR-associated exonuclease Cas4
MEPPPAPPLAVEDDLVPLSALQHYLFCPRQCGLIHVERVWIEDAATVEGRSLHARVDNGPSDRRHGMRTVRGLSVRSRALGVTGRADAVEFRGSAREPTLYPVEYKRGRPKSHRADEVQLCAQAICLEEMFGTDVPCGAIFYVQTRRRLEIAFDDDLRALTGQVAGAVRAMIHAGRTPLPLRMPACKRCSLFTVCQPEAFERPPVVSAWLARQVRD